jgi:chromosome segregation ATPase
MKKEEYLQAVIEERDKEIIELKHKLLYAQTGEQEALKAVRDRNDLAKRAANLSDELRRTYETLGEQRARADDFETDLLEMSIQLGEARDELESLKEQQ